MIEETFFLHPPDWVKTPPRPESTRLFKRYVASAPKLWPDGTSTYQGFYLMTADGSFLGGTFAQTQKDEAKRLMLSALAKMKSGGAAMRPVASNELAIFGGDEPRPGAVKLKIAYRDFPRGSVRRPSTAYIQNPYNLGWLDLSPSEVRAFVPDSDAAVAIPDALFRKIATERLKDAVRGQAGKWQSADLKSGSLKTERIAPNTYRLTGSADLQHGDRSYQPQLHGKVVIDPKTKEVREFELVAAGQRSGSHGANGRQNDLGPAPLGVAFQLYQAPAE